MSTTSLDSTCLVPSPYVAEFQRSPRLAGSLLEVQEQAGRGSGQAGWRCWAVAMPQGPATLLCGLKAFLSSGYLSLVAFPCKGAVWRVGSPPPGVSSSSLEKWGICQSPPSQTEKLIIFRVSKGSCARTLLLFWGRRLLLGAETSEVGWVGRDRVRQDVFWGRGGRKEEEDINQLSWWQDRSILALAFIRRKLSLCGNGVCVFGNQNMVA